MVRFKQRKESSLDSPANVLMHLGFLARFGEKSRYFSFNMIASTVGTDDLWNGFIFFE